VKKNDFQRKTIYGPRIFISQNSKVCLSIKTSFSCILLGFRIDGDERCRAQIGIHEVRSFRHGPLLSLAYCDDDEAERHMSVAALEATLFEAEWDVLQGFEVIVETFSRDIDICLVADVAISS
jgi:hypothetical protein